MHMIRRAILALALIAGFAPAFAQVPPPVPALPDTERRTTYSISATTCACAVNFAIYGDSTDVDEWIEVWIGATRYLSSDPNFGWSLSSVTGALSIIPRPITDAILTFNQAQTGTVQIVGARRPRRLSQFTENRGVAARDLNQALTDIIAQNRETWDRTNDILGRTVRVPPGETLATLPAAASRANLSACWDNSGNLTTCTGVSSSTFVAGTGIVFTGVGPTTISTTYPANAISNTSLAKMAAYSVKCNNTSALANATDCSTLALNDGSTGAWTFTPTTLVPYAGASAVNALQLQSSNLGGGINIPVYILQTGQLMLGNIGATYTALTCPGGVSNTMCANGTAFRVLGDVVAGDYLYFGATSSAGNELQAIGLRVTGAFPSPTIISAGSTNVFNSDTTGSAWINLHPDSNCTGCVPSGSLDLHAHGSKGDSNSNTINFITRSGVNVEATRLSIQSSGHIYELGPSAAPTVSSCGTGAVISGSDNVGKASMGSASTTCTITFGSAFATPPICVLVDTTHSGAVYTVSTTAISVTGATASDILMFSCRSTSTNS